LLSYNFHFFDGNNSIFFLSIPKFPQIYYRTKNIVTSININLLDFCFPYIFEVGRNFTLQIGLSHLNFLLFATVRK
jgi:hypothetical protein